MARMRTLPQAVKELKAADPATCISAGILRRWIAAGKITVVQSGRRFFIDLDALDAFMSGGAPHEESI